MEWFGLTIYGCPDAIKDMMRRDYEEPKVQPDLMEVIAKGSEKPFAELVAELDCYLGQCDGYAYKSYDRLLQMRRKGIFKPVEFIAKVTIKMEWFGMTRFGFPDVFKDLMKSDYKEPAVQEEVMEILAKGTTQSFSELASVLDCYIGRIDGYAYKSHDRLVRMRRKGAFKPVGPTDMYNYAGTNAMKFGFWNNDPALQNEDWYKTRTFKPRPTCDVTQYVNDMKKTDKYFRL